MNLERGPQLSESPLAAPLERLTRACLAAPGKVVIGAVVLALIAVLATASGLAMKTSRLDLLSPRSEYNQRWLAYLAEFGDRDDAIVLVRSPQPAKLAAALEDLAEKVRSGETHFESIFYRRDLSRVKGKALHFSSIEELRTLSQETARAAQLFPTADVPLDPTAVLAQLNNRLETIDVTTPQMRAQVEAQYLQTLGMIGAVIGEQTARPAAPGNSLEQLEARLLQLNAQYLTTDDGNTAFLLLKLKSSNTSEFARGSEAIGKLRAIITQARADHPDTWIGLTGMPIIEFDEMQASQTDMVWTSIASLIAVAFLFVAGYGGMRHALLACAVLLLGMAYAFGFVTLAIGHLNILSAAFGVILVGLGIDFGIHYVASYLRLRKNGYSIDEALMRTATDVGPSVLTGGITTAAGFFCAALTDFTGVRELGIVAGGGILLCVITAVTVLPALLKLVDSRIENREVPAILPAANWVRGFSESPRLTLAFFAVLTLVLCLGLFDLKFDHNLLNLQPRGIESAQIERELFIDRDDSVWFALSICENREELRARKAKFESLGCVAKTEEIVSLLPSSSIEKEQLIATIHKQLARLPDVVPSPAPLRADALLNEVRRASRLLAETSPQESPAAALAQLTAQSLAQIPPQVLEASWAQAQAAMMQTAIQSLRPLAELSNPEPPTLEDLPPELTSRFVGITHKHLIRVFAKGSIWDMDELATFVGELEKVDPQVTGHPVQTFYASQHMQQSYITAGLYALVAVFVLLVIDFRSFRASLLAMVPLLVGFLQMCGTIGWLGIPLNPANMIVLPLLLGIGVDDGVHLVHEMRRSRGRFKLSNSTAVAVILTSTTTMASFGSMILARHRGLQTLGQVLTIGVLCCLGMSLLGFPAFLTWLTRHREELDEDEEDILQLARGTTTPPTDVDVPSIPSTFAVPPAKSPTRVIDEPPPAEEPAPQPMVDVSPAVKRPQRTETVFQTTLTAQQAPPEPAPEPALEEPLPEEIESLLDSLTRGGASVDDSSSLEYAQGDGSSQQYLPESSVEPLADESSDGILGPRRLITPARRILPTRQSPGEGEANPDEA